MKTTEFAMKTALKMLALASLPVVLSCCVGHEVYHFKSTTHQPQSVTIVNTQTGESVWSQEIPVGKQLNVRFMRRHDTADSQGYDELRWSLSDLGSDLGGTSSSMRVPPPSERRIETHVRNTPELRPEAPAPMPEAAPMAAPMPAAAPTAKAPAPKPRPKAQGVVMPDPKQPAPR